MSLFSCFRPNKTGRNTALQPAGMQVDVVSPSLKTMVNNIKNIENIENTVVEKLLGSGRCIIETPCSYYTLSEIERESEQTSIKRTSKPFSLQVFFANIKRIVCSFAQQSRESKLTWAVSEAIHKMKWFRINFAHQAAMEQTPINSECRRVMGDAGINKETGVEKVSIEPENSLMNGMQKLPDLIINKMKSASSKQSLNELKEVLNAWNEQQQRVVKFSVNGQFTEALAALRAVVNKYDAILTGIPQAPTMLNDLYQQFINAGADSAILISGEANSSLT